MTDDAKGQILGAERFDGFICICSDEGKAEAEALMSEALESLSYVEPIPPHELLTSVVVSLNWDFQASITGIINDQWSVVMAENRDKSFSTCIQCDMVEHGIAATWKAFADHGRRRDEWRARDGSAAWTGADWSNEMCGEAGEAANVVKKLRRIETGYKGPGKTEEELKAHLAEELADVLICVDLLGMFYGIDLGPALVHKFNLTSEKQGLKTRLPELPPAVRAFNAFDRFGLADAGTAVEDLIDILGDDHDEEECDNLADLIEEVRVVIKRLREFVNSHKTINERRAEEDLPPLQGGDFALKVPGDARQMWAHDADAKICGKAVVSTQEALYAGSSLPSSNLCRLTLGHDGACNGVARRPSSEADRRQYGGAP